VSNLWTAYSERTSGHIQVFERYRVNSS